jgi:hypothetical protein
MPIRTKEGDTPSEFPPARLFLDDIEEIVGILRELVGSQKSKVDDPAVKVTFSVSGSECDDLRDLPKIAKPYRALDIEVERGWLGRTSLTFYFFSAFWRSYGLTREATLPAYHRLEPIFKKRKRHWATFARTVPWWVWVLVIGAVDLLLHVTHVMTTTFNSHIPFIVICVLAFITGARHTSVVLRYSWEPSPFFVYLKDKIIPLIAGALLGIFGTLLTGYIKHRYWP